MEEYVQDKIKEYRRILYLLKKYPTIKLDIKCIQAIKDGDSNYVNNWFHTKALNNLDSMTLKELRDKAALLRVYPIWGRPKSSLILAIMDKENESCKSEEVT